MLKFEKVFSLNDTSDYNRHLLSVAELYLFVLSTSHYPYTRCLCFSYNTPTLSV